MSDIDGEKGMGSFTNKLRDRAAKLAEKAADKLQNEEIATSIPGEASGSATAGGLGDTALGDSRLGDKISPNAASGVVSGSGSDVDMPDMGSSTTSATDRASRISKDLSGTSGAANTTGSHTTGSQGITGAVGSADTIGTAGAAKATDAVDDVASATPAAPKSITGSLASTADETTASSRLAQKATPLDGAGSPVPPVDPSTQTRTLDTTTGPPPAPPTPPEPSYLSSDPVTAVPRASAPVPPAPPTMETPSDVNPLTGTAETFGSETVAGTMGSETVADATTSTALDPTDAAATAAAPMAAAAPGVAGLDTGGEINARDVRTTGESWRQASEPTTPIERSTNWPGDPEPSGTKVSEGRYLASTPPQKKSRKSFWSLIALLALLAILAGGLLWWINRDDNGGSDNDPTDAELATQLDEEFDATDLADVEAEVSDGEATLTGTVAEEADIEDAADIATSVEGIDSANTEGLSIAGDDDPESSTDDGDDSDDSAPEEEDDGDDGEEEPENSLEGEAAEVQEELADLVTSDPITFESGSAALTSEAEATLDEVAEILNNSDVDVDIEAYTDNQGPANSNKALSEDRADAVLEYLTDNGGVDDDRLTAIGFGEDNTFDNGDVIEREKNRRIEFTVTG